MRFFRCIPVLAASIIALGATSYCTVTYADSDPVGIDLSPSSISRAKLQSTQVTATITIPAGKHIYGPERQTVGRKTMLAVTADDVEINPEITWPVTAHVQTPQADYEMYEGEQKIIIKNFQVPEKVETVDVTLSYILCDVECVPGGATAHISVTE